MPTPVAAARQCLTPESAAVLDKAVAVARRRGHAQTTSLHMVSSLLSLPTSSLREACTRARNNAYSTRVQFKALELSLGISLDRIPSSQGRRVDDPPVSNSLMAAIKRSQANQRRQPENFSFYQQQQQYSSCSSAPMVKVELQNLIVSILDDPLVSRVFGEAGFRSCDIKMATIRSGNSFLPSQIYGCASRYKKANPPLFLCNMGGGDGGENCNDDRSKGFSFPFMGCFSGDESLRRIVEVMLKGKKKCPLLLGISANESLSNFVEAVRKKTSGVLPDGLSGMCVKDEISRYLCGDCDEGPLKLRFDEAERTAERAAESGGRVGGGVVVSFGDFGALVGEDVDGERLRLLVGKFSRLVDLYGGKLWLIGAATTYEVYLKILNKFPNLEEDWQLEVLPITSIKFSMGGSYPRSSLMESFVPLGGFFSIPPETKSPLSNARCHLCNEKYEQEVAAVSNGDHHTSAVEKHQSSSPSWLQTAEAGSKSGLSSTMGTDDRLLLSVKIKGLQKKWDIICQQHHFGRAYTRVPRIQGFQVGQVRIEKPSNECSDNSNESSKEQGNKNASSFLPINLQRSSSMKELGVYLSKSGETPNDDRTSPASITSVTTDTGLDMTTASISLEPDKLVDHVEDVEAFTRPASNCSSQPSLRFHHDNQVHSDIVKDPKLLYRALMEKVGHQEEAVCSIIEALTQGQTKGNRNRNIWINIRGGDGLSKKKLGLTLSEILYRSRDSFIYADLSFQDEINHIDALFNSQITNKYELTMRGTVVDYLVEKLSKKPCLVFLDNIDKADLAVRKCLFQAVKTGRLADFYGREVNISNCIFLGATKFLEGNKSMMSHDEEEDDIASVRGRSIQIVIRFDLNDDPTTENSMMNKRKLISRSRSHDQCRRSLEMRKRAHKTSKSYLDLNLPAEGSEIYNAITVESDSDSTSKNSRSWLDELDVLVDRSVVFKPFDFATFGEKVMESIAECLHNVVGFKCSVEVETKAMQQIVAAAYLYDGKIVYDWIELVLRQGFVEAMEKSSLDDRSIVRVLAGDDAVLEGQPRGLLPARVAMK